MMKLAAIFFSSTLFFAATTTTSASSRTELRGRTRDLEEKGGKENGDAEWKLISPYFNWFWCHQPNTQFASNNDPAPQGEIVKAKYHYEWLRWYDPEFYVTDPDGEKPPCQAGLMDADTPWVRHIDITMDTETTMLIMSAARHIGITAPNWSKMIHSDPDWAPYDRSYENPGNFKTIFRNQKENWFEPNFKLRATLNREPLDEEAMNIRFTDRLVPLEFPEEDQCITQSDDCPSAFRPGSEWWCDYIVEGYLHGGLGEFAEIGPLEPGTHELFITMDHIGPGRETWCGPAAVYDITVV